jgi:rubrerythrin
VLYYALNRAWRYEAYITQAEEAGDETLSAFFREIQQEEWRRAERARELLRKRIGLIWDS